MGSPRLGQGRVGMNGARKGLAGKMIQDTDSRELRASAAGTSGEGLSQRVEQPGQVPGVGMRQGTLGEEPGSQRGWREVSKGGVETGLPHRGHNSGLCSTKGPGQKGDAV